MVVALRLLNPWVWSTESATGEGFETKEGDSEGSRFR